MPAVTADTLTLPRITAPIGALSRSVLSVRTAPSGHEGEGFPVRRAFAGVSREILDPFIHMDQMGEVNYAPYEPRGTDWHPHRGFETVTYIIDGIATDQIGQAGFSAEGVLLHASGIVGAVEKIGEYQTLDQVTLSDQLSNGSDVRGASSCIQDTVCEINEVKPGLVLVIDTAGTQWFVPGYVMRDTRGGQWVLRAVDITG